MEKIVDKTTEYAADVDNPDSLLVIHDFQLKAGGAILKAKVTIKKLRAPNDVKLEVHGPPSSQEGVETEAYADAETAFGHSSDGQGGHSASPATHVVGSSAATSKAGLAAGGWTAAGASGSGWFKESAPPSTSAQSSASVAVFEGDPAFYLALPPLWNVEPAGEKISFSDFTKLLTSGYIKKFKEKLADYPRFRMDFITNIHDARIPIVTKFP